MARLVAFVDGSIYSESVLDHAAWAALRLGAGVEIAHVIGPAPAGPRVDLSGNIGVNANQSLLEELAEHDFRTARLAQQRGRALLDSGADRLRAAGVEAVQRRLRNGDIVEAIQELEREATFAVVGKRGEAADFAKLHLGSNLERIARSTSKPLLVASREFRPIRRFLIAFDGGPSVRRAVAWLAGSPLFAGIPCEIITIGEDKPAVREPLEAAASTLRDAGFEVTTHMESGDPDRVIAAHAKADHIDFLVMGAYGHSKIRTLLLGSTTTEMIRSVRIPVMLFR